MKRAGVPRGCCNKVSMRLPWTTRTISAGASAAVPTSPSQDATRPIRSAASLCILRAETTLFQPYGPLTARSTPSTMLLLAAQVVAAPVAAPSVAPVAEAVAPDVAEAAPAVAAALAAAPAAEAAAASCSSRFFHLRALFGTMLFAFPKNRHVLAYEGRERPRAARACSGEAGAM